MSGWLMHLRLAHCKSARLRTSTAQHCGVPVRPVQRGVAACRFVLMVSVVGKVEARARVREAATRVVMCMVTAEGSVVLGSGELVEIDGVGDGGGMWAFGGAFIDTCSGVNLRWFIR